ncbi:MAG: FAD-binding domain-containing protein [Pseudomonadota bacterium]
MTDLFPQTIDFEPTRSAGLERLKCFVPSAGAKYQNERNFDYGPQDRSNVSALSPWIRHRLVTEEEVCAKILDQFALSSAEKFIQEVMWRTYWKGWLELHTSAFDMYQTDLQAAIEVAEANGAIRRDYNAATSGDTGIDCFDAWAKELVETGYLHNHARMWFASIWIFTLQLNWTLGADFFYRHLLDGDAASNTLSWRWIAGLQTLGKHYVARASNISKFTDGRFNPKGLNENTEALPGEPHGKPAMLEVSDPLPAKKNAFLLFTEDECRAEEIHFGTNDIIAGAAWNLSENRSSLKLGDKANKFTHGALEDALKRASTHFNCNFTAYKSGSAIEDIVQHIAPSGADIVISPYTPAGHARPFIRQLAARLRREKIDFFEVRRNWDNRAWPYATKGFFAFKEKIPQLLTDTGFEIKGKKRQVA